MTDVSLSKGVSTIKGENFDLEATVVCGSTGKLAYQFRTFDKVGDPAALRLQDIHGSQGKIATVRVDDGKPYQRWDFSRFDNQVLVSGPDADAMAAAKKIVLRFRLVNGDETYTLDQDGAKIRSVFQSCLPKTSASTTIDQPTLVSGNTGDMTAADPTPTATKAECWTPPSGPHVLDDPDRPISAGELEEIETVTGRQFQPGDSIYGRAEDRCPA